MKATTATLIPDDDTSALLDNFMTPISSRVLRTAAVKGARIIKPIIEFMAPLGPTGNLRRGMASWKRAQKGAVKSAVDAEAYRKQGPSAAFVKINWKRAPHAWLVSFDTKGRRYSRSGKKMVFPAYGAAKAKLGIVRIDIVAAMPANPFFAAAVTSGLEPATAAMNAHLIRYMERKLSKQGAIGFEN